jgi:DNA-binding transcriptional ArsR family regulator
MASPFEDLAGLDRLVHEPARLAVLTALQHVENADFLFVQRVTGLSKGNLSSHMTKLEEGGLVAVTKEFVGKIPQTRLGLTGAGRKAIDAYWKTMDRLRKETRRSRPS